MPESVQITIVVCGTIIVLAGLFVLLAWIGAQNKKNQK